ncbi:hypothetical protein GX420_05075 [bacterium]|nr:hypothetical protein [bacterium]
MIEGRYKLPIPVLSLDEENLKIKKANLVKVFSSGIKRVYLLKTQSGREIKASANHPFLTIDGWKRLDELEIGEHIATPRIVKIDSKEKYKDEELIFLAHMIGDGCYAPKQPIHYTSSDLENIKIVEKTSKILSVSYSGFSIFNNNLGRERLNRYANILESKYLYNLSNSDIYWDKIKEIKELGEEEVYDVTIDETHNFIANNIIVHNSIEQDADVVMFLNREDDDIGKDASTVELTVAKNRNGPLGKMKLKFLKNFAKFSEIEYSEEEGEEEF